MALSGTIVGSKTGYFGVEIDWSGKQSVELNYTDITAKVYITYWSINISGRTLKCTIDGTSYTASVGSINHYPNKNYRRLLATFTKKVDHDPDGSKIINISASFPFNLNSSSKGYVGTLSASSNVTLTTIPRAASIDKITNSSGSAISSIETGNSIRVYFTPKTTAYKYRITLKIGSAQKAQNSSSGASVSSTSQTYNSFSVAHSWLPSNETGTLICTLETLNGTTVIGSSTKTIYISVPKSIIPSISDVSASYLSAGNSIVDEWGVFVQGKSKATISVTGLSAGSGSSLSSCVIKGNCLPSNDMSISGSSASIETNVLSSTSLTYSIYVVDQRGRKSETKSITINPIGYSGVKVIELEAKRCDESGNLDSNGTYFKCSFYGLFCDVGGRNNINSLISGIYYKKSNDIEWELGHSIDNTTQDLIIGDGSFDIATEYDVMIQLYDTIGSYDSLIVKLAVAERTFNVAKYGNGLAIGQLSTVTDKNSDGLFEIGWNADFNKGLNIDGGLTLARKALIDVIYPVGSIYMSVNNVSPQSFFGGVWEQIKDKFLLSAGDTYSAGSTGGEATHTLTVSEMPSHEGHLETNTTNWNGNNNLYLPASVFSSYGTTPRGWATQATNEVVPAGENKGGGQAHNNMPPYLTVYVWKRIS